jgi:uncharacterized membrane protein YfcA
MVEFVVSGVETYWWLPILVGLVISTMASVGGLSGAFLLLPFQVSVLGFNTPAVTPTNLIFNIIGTPFGVYKFWKERRMIWPLAWTFVAGTIPGVFIGAYFRVRYLPEPSLFRVFAGAVLLFIGSRLLLDIIKKSPNRGNRNSVSFNIEDVEFSLRNISYSFEGERYSVATWPQFALALIFGAVGSAYGIGGGAILVPLMVTFFRLPVYTVGGVALFQTFVNSLAGVISYLVLDFFNAGAGMALTPDWVLGLMFGIGGAIGIYIGAGLQKFLPARLIKAVITVLVLFVAVKYVAGYIAR